MYCSKAKNLDFTLMQIFLFVLPFLFGLFYEFTSFLAQVFIIIILVIKLIKEKNAKVYLNCSSITLAIISAGYLFTCIYAVDRGMAFLGFLKFSVPLTFAFLLMQYSKEQSKEIMNVIPFSGVTMIILSVLFRYIPFLPDEFYMPNGRIGGFFQYSNTFALYLLIGIIQLSYSEKNKIKKIVFTAILLAGIFLSGSRAVFILAILNLIFIIIKFKETRKELIGLVILAIVATAIYVSITGNINTIGRFLTTSTSSSTLLGRILYYKDAFFVILKHPFGLGYMGYSYIQPQIQTGVYKTMYVHNDLLQFALDIGIIPMIVFIVCVFKNLINKQKFNLPKQILITIFLHILVDFDLQFLSIFLIFVLTLDIWKEREYQFEINKKVIATICTIIVGIYLYFAIATWLNYIDKNEIASKMYPVYTEANLSLAYKYSEEDNIGKANKIASMILETNENAELAYNIKALYYMQNKNWSLMEQNKQRAIEIAKYEISNYNEYVLMLSGAIDYYVKNDEMKKATEFIKKVIEVPSKIEQLKSSTSNISYKLRDIPDFELSDNVQKYIITMKGVLEND